MNTQCLRIADQLHRAFDGDPWHGSPVREILSGLSEGQASKHVLASGHSIWELVNHVNRWERAALGAINGVPMPQSPPPEVDWPAPSPGNETAWKSSVDQLFTTNKQLVEAIKGLQDSRLQETVPGRSYDFYYLLLGIIQHGLYHAGQMAILRKGLA
ncbi:MAG TPA: DinB family protein [Candidatus Angelobacter sp.]|nr:DinB family protein [Candidatus Angelobacter sp.]